jgi:hypothetical protein
MVFAVSGQNLRRSSCVFRANLRDTTLNVAGKEKASFGEGWGETFNLHDAGTRF